MSLENYTEMKFTEYVRHKGDPEWEIAWNKRQIELINKEPNTCMAIEAREKRLNNIKYWEEKKKSATRGN